MAKEIITSLNNTFIKDLVKLQKKKYRDEKGMTLVEGEHLVEEATKANLVVSTIGESESCDIQITDIIAKKISQTVSGSSIFALIHKKKPEAIEGERILMCDGIQDPGNLGTIIRSAHSFGFDTCVLSKDSVDEYNDKVIRASQGSIFHMNIVRADLPESIQQLEQQGIHTYASYLGDHTLGLSQIDPQQPLAIVLGSEGQGVSDAVLHAAHGTVKIETSQFESLNVAIAAGIICYTLRK